MIYCKPRLKPIPRPAHLLSRDHYRTAHHPFSCICAREWAKSCKFQHKSPTLVAYRRRVRQRRLSAWDCLGTSATSAKAFIIVTASEGSSVGTPGAAPAAAAERASSATLPFKAPLKLGLARGAPGTHHVSRPSSVTSRRFAIPCMWRFLRNGPPGRILDTSTSALHKKRKAHFESTAHAAGLANPEGYWGLDFKNWGGFLLGCSGDSLQFGLGYQKELGGLMCEKLTSQRVSKQRTLPCA